MTDAFAPPLTVPSPSTTAHTAAEGVDSAHFRRSLSHFATGVTVVTSAQPDAPADPETAQHALVGVTISSFNSVSLSPPLVLWSLGAHASSLSVFEANPHHVIHVLGVEQAAWSAHFAYAQGDRFAGIAYQLNAQGVPVLEGVTAWFECRVRSRYAEGDHVIFVSEVLRCGHAPAGSCGPALVYAQGQLGAMRPLP